MPCDNTETVKPGQIFVDENNEHYIVVNAGSPLNGTDVMYILADLDGVSSYFSSRGSLEQVTRCVISHNLRRVIGRLVVEHVVTTKSEAKSYAV